MELQDQKWARISPSGGADGLSDDARALSLRARRMVTAQLGMVEGKLENSQKDWSIVWQ